MRRFILPVFVALLTFFSVGSAVRSIEQHRRFALQVDSIEASHDKERATFADGLRVVERRAVQAEIARDSLARTLKARDMVKTSASVTVASIDTSISGITDVQYARKPTMLIDSLSADFSLYRTPYTVAARAVLFDPPNTVPPRLTLAVALDTAFIDIRLLCETDAGAAGVHRSKALISSPEWLTVNIRSTQSDPRVCSPPPSINVTAPKLGAVVTKAAALAVGVVIGIMIAK